VIYVALFCGVASCLAICKLTNGEYDHFGVLGHLTFHRRQMRASFSTGRLWSSIGRPHWLIVKTVHERLHVPSDSWKLLCEASACLSSASTHIFRLVNAGDEGAEAEMQVRSQSDRPS
jgi:hypothetical protein